MEKNTNQLIIPEASVTGSGKTTPSVTPSPPPSVGFGGNIKMELRTFSFTEIIVSPEANKFVKGKGTSQSNLTWLESTSQLPTNEIGP
jgi:hypothetical protein